VSSFVNTISFHSNDADVIDAQVFHLIHFNDNRVSLVILSISQSAPTTIVAIKYLSELSVLVILISQFSM